MQYQMTPELFNVQVTQYEDNIQVVHHFMALLTVTLRLSIYLTQELDRVMFCTGNMSIHFLLKFDRTCFTSGFHYDIRSFAISVFLLRGVHCSNIHAVVVLVFFHLHCACLVVT